MFKEMTPKKKFIIIGIIVLVVVVIIVLVVRSRKKKKQAAELTANNNSNYGGNVGSPVEPRPQPQYPKMQIVPDEDKVVESKPEPVLSVKESVPEKAPTTSNAPGTLGVPSIKKEHKAQPARPVGTSLPPEFMQDANNPNAQA